VENIINFPPHTVRIFSAFASAVIISVMLLTLPTATFCFSPINSDEVLRKGPDFPKISFYGSISW